MAGETVILRPIHEKVRNVRGEVEQHQAGFGHLRKKDGQIELLADGAPARRRGHEREEQRH